MNYLSLAFFVFFIVFFAIYYIVKPPYRYIVIFVGSYVFYGYANPSMLLVLMGVTVISYIGGFVLNKKKSRWIYAVFFILEILFLATFKYYAFIVDNVNFLLDKIFSIEPIVTNWNIVLPIGLSFMVFQACNYLSDVYRDKMSAEKNIIRYAAYVAFFPTVLSGPIQKARNLIPQIANPKRFESEQAKKGVILFTWGAFEKIMISNNLSELYYSILSDYNNRSSAEVAIGAILFSIYIYADFSSYSDMARGVAKILGIEVGKNFNNPYLSQSTSEFWNRWHISLNEWFIENIYIPLGGNRKGIIRKYINVMIVFIISGFWHGAAWHFVVWGIINGVFVVIGDIIKPIKSQIYKDIKIDEKAEYIVYIRRIIVFCLITLSWVFFASGIQDSIEICKKIVLFDNLSIFDKNLLNIAGSTTQTFFVLIMLLIFCAIQLKRQNEGKVYEVYSKQPFLLQCLPIAILICVCIFGAWSTDTYVNSQFLYFQF